MPLGADLLWVLVGSRSVHLAKHKFSCSSRFLAVQLQQVDKSQCCDVLQVPQVRLQVSCKYGSCARSHHGPSTIVVDGDRIYLSYLRRLSSAISKGGTHLHARSFVSIPGIACMNILIFSSSASFILIETGCNI
jgi:hypothetical protein